MSIRGAHFKLLPSISVIFPTQLERSPYIYVLRIHLHFLVDVPVICYPFRNVVLVVASEQCMIYPSEVYRGSAAGCLCKYGWAHQQRSSWFSSHFFLIQMLSFTRPHVIFRSISTTRPLNQPTVTQPQTASLQYPYFVPRNSRGNLPVYTDVRNGGSRYQVLVRNVEGNASVSPFSLQDHLWVKPSRGIQILAKHLAESLFEGNTPEASRMKIEVVRSKHLVVAGGHWKNEVVEWLRQKGF